MMNPVEDTALIELALYRLNVRVRHNGATYAYHYSDRRVTGATFHGFATLEEAYHFVFAWTWPS